MILTTDEERDIWMPAPWAKWGGATLITGINSCVLGSGEQARRILGNLDRLLRPLIFAGARIGLEPFGAWQIHRAQGCVPATPSPRIARALLRAERKLFFGFESSEVSHETRSGEMTGGFTGDEYSIVHLPS